MMKKILSIVLVGLMVWGGVHFWPHSQVQEQTFGSTLSVQDRSQGGGSASASTIVSVGTTNTAGNLLVAMITNQVASNISSVTDTAGNTYVLAGSEYKPTGQNIWYDIYYAKNITGNIANVITVNLTSGSTYRSVVVYEIAGADITAPLNTTKNGEGTSTSMATASVTLSASEEIIVAMGVANIPTVVGTGYTGTIFNVTGDLNTYYIDEYHVVTGNEAATATCNNSAWGMLAASFKATAGGGTPTPTATPQRGQLIE